MTEQITCLVDKHCVPCEGGVAALDRTQAEKLLSELHSDWQLSADGSSLERRLKFKNFAKTMYFVNTLAWLADREGHHPDASFGYNYCQVVFTTHAAKGLTDNDFVCAAKLDKLLQI
ncbi:4a-hydroxytetrahydrobiopterin dehydratase [Marinicella sp. W31]|uniref:4a-hydroxytetrahydrobiopterin dehydratase n=1 Tax=Marinicella sp. W31 TaxID=3023713 RepID=UPI0037580F14